MSPFAFVSAGMAMVWSVISPAGGVIRASLLR
jgi:hypothetical protein